MSQYDNNEYLEDFFRKSLTSMNPSKDTFDKSYICSSAYYDDLKENLKKMYFGKDFSDFEGVGTISTDYGKALEIKNTYKIDFELKENDLNKKLLGNLQLIPGIGVKTEEKLKNNGIDNLIKLSEIDRYADKVDNILKIIEDNDFNNIYSYLKNYGDFKDFNPMMCASRTDIENYKFMDIETMGLSNVPIILIGVASISNNKITVRQYLQREGLEEAAIIDGYLSNLDDDSVHVTYNGARFDVPYIKNRAEYFGMEYGSHLNYDLLDYTRKMYKSFLKNCKLPTVESYICGFERFNDVPGQYIPAYYKDYVFSKNIGPLVPIVRHNRLDVKSLADFFLRIYNDINF